MSSTTIIPAEQSLTSTSLTDLAKQINNHHRQAEASLNAGLHHALEAGWLLLKAKGQVGYGQWLPWLIENFEGSERTAQYYTRVAREFPKLNGNTKRVADLSFRQAIAATTDGIQRFTKLPPEIQEEVICRAEGGKSSLDKATTMVLRERRAESVAKADNANVPLHLGDFRQLGQRITDESVDLIFTDPPYSEAGIPLYSDLAKFAARVLRPGGWCLAYSGQIFLPEILARMATYLTYGWTFAIHFSSVKPWIRKFQVQNGWKPIVGFFKPPLQVWWPGFSDVASGGREKDSHDWQQSQAEAEHFIQALSPPGGLVCEPFCGGGTTPAACIVTGRQWVAFEIDEAAYQSSLARITLLATLEGGEPGTEATR